MTASPSDDDWIFDPSLSAIDRSIRRELRAEAEEVESIVTESELRERTLADAALEARNRGDIVSVGTARRVFTGVVAYAGRDFITVRTDAFEADVNLEAVVYLRVAQRNRQPGGVARQDSAGSFDMRLTERRSTPGIVEFGYRDIEDTLMGRVTYVAQDHVVVVTEQREEWTIPTRAIAFAVYRRRTR